MENWNNYLGDALSSGKDNVNQACQGQIKD